jgi:hypothetical protein
MGAQQADLSPEECESLLKEGLGALRARMVVCDYEMFDSVVMRSENVLR